MSIYIYSSLKPSTRWYVHDKDPRKVPSEAAHLDPEAKYAQINLGNNLRSISDHYLLFGLRERIGVVIPACGKALADLFPLNVNIPCCVCCQSVAHAGCGKS